MEMKKMALAALAIILGGSDFLASAQITNNALEKRVFKVKYQPSFIDNYSYKVFYLSEGKVYNLRDIAISEKLKNVNQIAVQPGGAACAVLVKRGDSSLKKTFSMLKNKGLSTLKGKEVTEEKPGKVQSWIDIFDADAVNSKVGKIEDANNEMISICYSPDGKSLATGFSSNEVRFYDTKQYQPYTSVTVGVLPMLITLSENNYFAAVSDGSTVEVWNLQSKDLRTSLQLTASATALTFSADNTMMAVLTSDGIATVYETRSFSPRYKLENMGSGISCYFHPDNKYLGVVTDANTIILQNVRNASDKFEIKSYNGGVTDIRFVQDIKDPEKSYLLYPSGNGVIMQALAGLQPNRSQQLTESVNARMNEWMKMMDGESMEDYRIRVNDETRAKQQLAFEREIATEMAGDMISAQTITLGNYNAQKNLLALEFDGMPSIALDIPKDEVASFGNASNLAFSNTVYGVNENDQFEVIYTEVLNKETGKRYVYDNLDRKSVTAMTVDEGFVPLELVQQSSMEEMKLKDIRKQVVETAKKENKISDRTHINVNTEVLSDVDASGKSIMNYKVSYGYEVEKDFVAKEDFPSGKYKTQESNAAISMLKIVEKAFSTDFAQYIKPGKRIRIKVTGTADAAPIVKRIAYDGCYGDFANELIYKNGQLANISVSKASGIAENDQLAFLRAMGVKNYIDSKVTSLKDMICDYQYNIELSDKKGGEYRRISVEFLFMDAFEK